MEEQMSMLQGGGSNLPSLEEWMTNMFGGGSSKTQPKKVKKEAVKKSRDRRWYIDNEDFINIVLATPLSIPYLKYNILWGFCYHILTTALQFIVHKGVIYSVWNGGCECVLYDRLYSCVPLVNCRSTDKARTFGLFWRLFKMYDFFISKCCQTFSAGHCKQ